MALRLKRDPLESIIGFSGRSLRDQLRRVPVGNDDDELPVSSTLPRSEAPLSRRTFPQPLETDTSVPATEPTPRSNLRLVPSSQQQSPLDSARARLSEEENQPLTFGTDSEGNVRYSPKKGFGHRLLAGLKVAGRAIPEGMRQYGVGGGIGAGIAGLIGGAVDPSVPAKYRQQDRLATARAGVEQAEADQERQQVGMLRAEQLRKLAQPKEPEPYTLSPGQSRYEGSNVIASIPALEKPEKEIPRLNPSRTAMVDDQEVYIDDNGDPIPNSQGQPIVKGIKTRGESQEDADKREAEKQSVISKAKTAKGQAENLHQKLQPLYEQRNQTKAQLDSVNKLISTDPNVKTSDAVIAQRNELSAQLRDLDGQIRAGEKERDKLYSEAGNYESEAQKYERPVRPSNQPGSKFNLRAWKRDHPKATQAEIDGIKKRAQGAKMSVIE